MNSKYSILLLAVLFVASCLPVEQAPTPTEEPAEEIIPILTPETRKGQIPLPPAGALYHGVFPDGPSGIESDITLKDLRSYEDTVGKTAAWVYFSHQWFEGASFPRETAEWIRAAGSVPYIRMMTWSEWRRYRQDALYSPQNIVEGRVDSILRSWCGAAREFGTPLIVEYGTEVNLEWTPWNGMWNGAEELDGYGDPNLPDGPERFRDSYRHIIRICREEGADNITWVFHINSGDVPKLNEWNRFEYYYPGDEWIDWIGLSTYAAQAPSDEYWENFTDSMDLTYTRLKLVAPDKPIIIAEMGAPQYHPLGDQAEWAREALTAMLSGRYPRVIGFSWWNEWWQNDDNPDNASDMRVQNNSALAAVFRELVGENDAVLGRVEP